MLQLRSIDAGYGSFQALFDISLDVNAGEAVAVIGPNGAGKTTLCDVISGKTRVTDGHVYFNLRETTAMSEVEIASLGVGRKFQTPTVFDSLTVYENMELALPGRRGVFRNLWTRETPEQRDRIMALLERVHLADQAHRRARYLSHGQRQWLEISMLIIASPRLLLVDEPAAGLSDKETELTAQLLLELKGTHTIIVIEHDMEFVRTLNSRVTVLNEGQVLAEGSLDEVSRNKDVIEAYLGR
jgi:urea transport system ATP-binding protein